ncbi:hypothetical protein EMPS_04728 [Entomortierella parvispora]|uniref:Uncharacterized protein n=1 Tax=Entomortierella parvispora TaxID=205924 RepID=A0A9P3LVN8_9FUNG|nr:hypothetical protein EMPS_04728 [Entomortierella parvispora]
MNIFGRKKKQEEPAPTQPVAASAPTTNQAARDRNNANRGSSVNNITIPPRTNSTGATPNAASGPVNQHGPSTPNAANTGNSPRNNNNLELQLQQQLVQQQQQQQFYLQQQQAQQLQFQQQQQQQQQQHADTASLNSAMLPQQQAQQSTQTSGTYNGDQLVSQPIQYPSYHEQQTQGGSAGVNEPPHEGGYAGGAMQEDQQSLPQDSNGHPDGYYGQQPSFENGSGTLNSGPLVLPGDTANSNSSNGGSNAANGLPNDFDDINNNNNAGASSGEPSQGSGELVLSTDVRKLQEEVLSWQKSQEVSQAKVGQLRQTLTQKSQENRELHQSLTQVTQDRLMLQELVHKREKEMDDLRSKYLSDVRQIRATDDDHSTIEQRIRMLQAAILQFTKSSAGDRAANLNQDEAQQLVKKKYKFGNTQPYILNMFLEKFIMDSLLEDVFHGPFYVGFSLAPEYSAMYKWMIENSFTDQAVRFRQQVCFMSAKSPVAQAHAQEEAVRIAKIFEVKLEKLYNNWTGYQKILDLVTKAIELSLTMRSQNAEIQAVVIPGDTDFDPERMVPAHKSKDGGKVKVCVMPCFVDTNGVVVGKAKVFCG